MARGALLGLVLAAWLLGAASPAAAVQSGTGDLAAADTTPAAAALRELSGVSTETSTTTLTLTSSTKTTSTQTSTATTTTTTTTTTTITSTVTSTTTSMTTTTTSTTTITITSTTTTFTTSTTTVTVTVRAVGLTYCPSANYFLEQPSSTMARCSASTSRRAPGPVVTQTATATSTTTQLRTVTGSQAFSVSLISLCCRSKGRSSTRPPYTSMNYLYHWPTTTTRPHATSQRTLPTTRTLTTTTFTSSTTSTSTNTVTGTNTSTTTATSTVTLTTTTSTTSTTTTSRTTVPGAPTLTSTTTISTTATTTTTTSSTTDSTTVTTTTTSSTSTTSVTSTTTSTTITSTTSTSVTSTTTTTSSTTSTTTASTTTTTSSTTTTSPRLYNCRPPCSRFPVTGCGSELPSNGQCMASKIDTHCVSSEPLTFMCPIWNIDPLRRPDVVGEFKVRCQVCGLAPWHLKDLDPRIGYLQLELQFGPNAYQGQILEDGISGYAVFMTDRHGVRYSGSPVATVYRRQDQHHRSDYCCRDTLYSVRIATRFPANVTRVMFEVVPITRAGPLPSGRLTSPIDDVGLLVAATSAAPRARSRALAALLALAAAAAARAGDPG